MQNAKQISLYVAISFWAMIIGAAVYSSIVYFPPYLSHLPESNSLITGEYGIKDGNFWMLIHPVTLLATIVTLILNRKFKARKKLIGFALIIYAIALIVTALYFVPSLIDFANSTASDSASDLYQRGQTWQYLSWIRAGFMFIGFLMLLIALSKNTSKEA